MSRACHVAPREVWCEEGMPRVTKGGMKGERTKPHVPPSVMPMKTVEVEGSMRPILSREPLMTKLGGRLWGDRGRLWGYCGEMWGDVAAPEGDGDDQRCRLGARLHT